MTKPHTTLSEAIRALECKGTMSQFVCLDDLKLYNSGFDEALSAAADLVEQHEAQEPVRQVLHVMEYDDGRIGWYFNCDGHYIDVDKYADGKYSVFFKDRATGKEAWLDQADAQPTLAATQAGDAWQPIETAPRDGREVLLYLPAPFDRIAKATWFEPWGNWLEGETPDPIRDEYCGIGSALPTHWMLLPSAPTTTRSE